MRTKALLILPALFLVGCNTLGPAVIESARTPYNDAVVRSNNEQLLLNLVRLKYRDVPLFLDLTSISTQYSWSASASGSGSYPQAGSESFGTSIGISGTEKPTVTYVPLAGDRFVRQIMSPIPLGTLVLLSQSGWSGERVLRCCVQEINGVPNAPSAAGPTPDYVPRYENFAVLARAFRQAQTSRTMSLVAQKSESGAQIHMNVAESATELRGLLGLSTGRSGFPFVTAFHTFEPDTVSVTPRSLLGVMYYLSQNIEVPEDDVEDGKVTVTRREDGSVFDWSELTGDLFRINSSSRRPDDAAVAVRYRGSWFYVDDSDLESKSTFGLLSYLFALQSGDRKAISPALTLDLGG